MAYTQVIVSNYNASPPTDDGSTETINRVTWAGQKTKLADPVKTAIESIDDNVASACDATDAAITAVAAAIAGLDTDVEDTTGKLYAPSDTKTFFVQTAAPTLWTKLTALDDYALRLVTGTVGTGGSTAFTSVFASRTITSSNMPSHTHSFSDSGDINFNNDFWSTSISFSSAGRDSDPNEIDAYQDFTVERRDLAGFISFSGTTGSTGSGTAMDFAVQYVDVILAEKD